MLARPGPIHETEPHLHSRVSERVVERKVAGERRHRHVVARLGPRMDEVAGQEAAPEAERKIPPDSARWGTRGALPDPDRQQRLDGHAHEEVEGEKRPGLRRQQGERQEAEMVPVLSEDQGVEQQETGPGAGQCDADRQDHARPRDQHDHGDQQEERDVGERGQMAHVGERRVYPGDRGPEPDVVPEIAQPDDSHERRVDDGEPASPAEQPSPGAHRSPPGRRPSSIVIAGRTGASPGAQPAGRRWGAAGCGRGDTRGRGFRSRSGGRWSPVPARSRRSRGGWHR